MTCLHCGKEFLPRQSRSSMCSSKCQHGRIRKKAKERYHKATSGLNPIPEYWKPVCNNPRKIPVQKSEGYDLNPVKGPVYEQMMDNLHRLAFTLEDEIHLIFGKAQALGRCPNTTHTSA